MILRSSTPSLVVKVSKSPLGYNKLIVSIVKIVLASKLPKRYANQNFRVQRMCEHLTQHIHHQHK